MGPNKPANSQNLYKKKSAEGEGGVKHRSMTKQNQMRKVSSGIIASAARWNQNSIDSGETSILKQVVYIAAKTRELR